MELGKKFGNLKGEYNFMNDIKMTFEDGFMIWEDEENDFALFVENEKDFYKGACRLMNEDNELEVYWFFLDWAVDWEYDRLQNLPRKFIMNMIRVFLKWKKNYKIKRA